MFSLNGNNNIEIPIGTDNNVYSCIFGYMAYDIESINFLSSPQVWDGWLNLEFGQERKTMSPK